MKFGSMENGLLSDAVKAAKEDENSLGSGDIPFQNILAAHEELFSIYDRMVGDVHIPTVLQEVADVVCNDLHAERATVYLINTETEELESVAVVGNVNRMIHVPIKPSSLAGFCAMTGRTFLVPDAYGDLSEIDPNLHFDRTWDEINNFRTRDVMCSPAMFKGDALGVVQVINSRTEPFTAEDLLPLKSLSRLIGYALYHAKLYDDLATMKKLEKEKAEFMRVMVHELKSPTAATKMLTEMVQTHKHENPKVIELHGRISDRMDQMLDLIKDILVLAKTKSGEPMGEIAVLDIKAETQGACAIYIDQAKQKGLTMDINLPDKPLSVRMDLQGCKLVLSNLISNAVKYTPAGAVTVSLEQDNTWAVLKVQDSGIGIPEKDIPRLFREFFRASNAKANKISGSGVGLSGVKNIVERFSGELEFQSVENKGSTFTVRLPIFSE